MTTIPLKRRALFASDPFYKQCTRNAALHDHTCAGDPATGRFIEWEHAIIYAGRKVQERFAIVPLCFWAHRGEGAQKNINVWIALNRASSDELLALSHKGGRDYFRLRAALNKKYGVYKVGENPVNSVGINY